jgi:DNA polymerase epsilon subunit 1
MHTHRLPEIAACLLKRFEGCKVVQVELEDLDLANHLSGKKHKFLKITFNTSGDLNDAKKALKPLITANQKMRANSDYEEEDFEAVDNSANVKKNQMKASHDPLTHIIDIREFDVVSAVCGCGCGWVSVGVGVGGCGCGCVWVWVCVDVGVGV